jgi:predicted ATP-grasp superfamily ATP-dependent carboligase
MADTVRYVIFSGANERAIIAICRSFWERSVACSVVARPGADLLQLTRFSVWIDAVRTVDRLDLNDMLSAVALLRHKFVGERLVFLPTSESVIRVLLEHRIQFEAAGLEIPLVSKTVYQQVSDKHSFLSLASNFGVPLPPVVDIPTADNLPLVAKPRCELQAGSSRKLYPELLFSSADLQRFEKNCPREEYFFQRYLDGNSYYYLAYFPQDGEPLVRYQRNLLQQPNGKSIIAAQLCPCPDERTRDALVRALRSVGFFGFVMIEVMELNGVFYLIEANPRFWGPFELALKAGFLPDFIVEGGGDMDCKLDARYFWSGGLLSAWAEAGTPRSYLAKRLGLLEALSFLVADIYLRIDTRRLLAREWWRALRKVVSRKCFRRVGVSN